MKENEELNLQIQGIATQVGEKAQVRQVQVNAVGDGGQMVSPSIIDCQINQFLEAPEAHTTTKKTRGTRARAERATGTSARRS